jgi:signal transduction histidine kinase
MSDFYLKQFRKIIFLIILLLPSFHLSVASTRIDSLRNILSQHEIHDTVVIETNFRLAWELKSNQPALALEHARKALTLAERLNRKDKIADALSHIGVIYWQLGSFNMALDFHLEANSIYVEINDETGIARSLTNIGIIFSDQSHYEKALEYYFRALSLYDANENLLGMAALFNNIGMVYDYQGDFDLAERYHLKSLEIKAELNDQKGMAFSYNNLGLVYQGQSKFDKAREFFNKALTIREELNDLREIANTCSNLGYLNYQMRRYDLANDFLFRALRLYDEVDDKSGLAKTYNYLGKVSVENNEFISGEGFFERSLAIAKQIGLNRILTENYLDLARLMAKTGNYERAYGYQKQFVSIKDSIFNEDNRRRIFELQMMYDREMKESELQILRKNEQINFLSLQKHRLLRNFLIAGVVLILVLLFLLYNRFLIARNSNILLEKQKKEISQTNHQLVELNHSLMEQKKMFEELNHKLNVSNQKLKESEKHLIETNATKDKFFSIISHDLRNPFASIVSFSRILKRDMNNLSTGELQELAAELDKSVLKINNLLENLLHWSRAQTGKIKYKPEYIALHEIVKDNINLFRNNAREKEIELTDNVDDDLAVWADRNMTDTVIRNLLSNALKYTQPGGKISIASKVEDHKAFISVADNGVGMSDMNKKKIFRTDTLHSTYGTMDEKGSGLGLLLCKEFVEKQGGVITFESELEKGSTFTFTIPLEPVAQT